MIAEKSHTAQELMDHLSAKGAKVPFVPQEKVAAALAYLERNGMPTARNEEYKYCNIDGILRKEFKNPSGNLTPISDVSEWKSDDAINLFMVNGNYMPSLSDKPVVRGLTVTALSEMDPSVREKFTTALSPVNDALVALNTAYSGNGICIHVSPNTSIPMPLRIVSINSADGSSIVNPRSLVVVEDGASLTLIEEQRISGNGKIFGNILSEKFVGAGAKLETYTLQDEGPGGFAVQTVAAHVAAAGVYHNVTVTVSGQLVRNNHHVSLDGERAGAHLYGLFHTRGSQIVDNHTAVDHRVPDCESNELYKGIADERSTGVFNGKIFVRRHAQKTNAYQSSKNILLSDDATINAKPQLEIYANDVKCSHGTSTGRIDENAVFYLKSRGIGEESARRILLASFAGEVIDRIEPDALRERVYTFFDSGLSV